MTQRFVMPHLWTGARWLQPGFVEVNNSGIITRVDAEKPAEWSEGNGPETERGVVIPSFPNVHSHAFQYAMAGMTEHRGDRGDPDNFWSWRTRMYQVANAIDPAQQQAIASMAYLQMLKRGITAVGEFHYLHHQPDGTPYANRAEMDLAVVDAALSVGLRITLLPVLYQTGGFGRPAEPHQRRFLHPDLAQYLRLVEALKAYEAPQEVRIGYAPHSLRAVPDEALKELVRVIPGDTPFHIHIAEQQREVDEFQASHGGKRPVEWLCEEFPVDDRWTLVHATHTNESELERMTRSGATVGLCPITEANLGDGLFPFGDFLARGGLWGIGTDSNVRIDFLEELRLLEYGQRLLYQARNIGATDSQPDTGTSLLSGALTGGARSLGLQVGRIEPSYLADWVVIDPNHPSLIGRPEEWLLSALIFAGDDSMIQRVRVTGEIVIEQGHHRREDEIRREYNKALRSLNK